MAPAAAHSRNPPVRCSARIQSPDGPNQPELIKAQVLIYIQLFPFKLTQPLVGASTALYDLNSGQGDFSEVSTRLKGFWFDCCHPWVALFHMNP